MTGLIMGLLGSAILTVTTTFWGVVACVAMTGLGFAAIYPVLVAWLTLLFAERAPKIGSAMFILAAMGGATMPWLVGFLSTHGNNLRAGLLVPVAACAVMLVFLLWIPRRVAS